MKMMTTDRLVVAADNEESVAENDISLLQLLLVCSNLWIKMFMDFDHRECDLDDLAP